MRKARRRYRPIIGHHEGIVRSIYGRVFYNLLSGAMYVKSMKSKCLTVEAIWPRPARIPEISKMLEGNIL